jgi:hypothetical protein
MRLRLLLWKTESPHIFMKAKANLEDKSKGYRSRKASRSPNNFTIPHRVEEESANESWQGSFHDHTHQQRHI